MLNPKHFWLRFHQNLRTFCLGAHQYMEAFVLSVLSRRWEIFKPISKQSIPRDVSGAAAGGRGTRFSAHSGGGGLDGGDELRSNGEEDTQWKEGQDTWGRALARNMVRTAMVLFTLALSLAVPHFALLSGMSAL